MQPFLSQPGEMRQFLEREFYAQSQIPPPQNIEELRRIFAEIEPHECLMSAGFGFERVSPFPTHLVRDIQQADVDVVHGTIAKDFDTLGFESSEPLCYSWLAMEYYNINRAVERQWHVEEYGLPFPARYQEVSPEDVGNINNLLARYAAEGISVPAVFFISAHGALMQAGIQDLRDRKTQADSDLEGVTRWVQGLKKTITELLEGTSGPDSWPAPIPGGGIVPPGTFVGFWSVHSAKRQLMAPGNLPMVAIASELSSLGLREPLEKLLFKIEGIMDQVVVMEQDQGDYVEKIVGLKQGSRHVQPLKTAFIALREVIDAGRPGKRGARKELRDLLGWWGAEVSEHASNIWVRQEHQRNS